MSTPAKPNPNAPTILIADDDIKLLTALACRLENAGYNVLKSQDAYQAFAIAVKHAPSLLLLDINMPAGTGFSVQQRVEQHDDLTDIPVIYMTGESADNINESADQCLAPLDNITILRKPFESEELMELIERALKTTTTVAA
ncbi:MAG: response regulator [Planctomycetota bacterium]